MKKRILSILLTLCVVLTLMPAASAEDAADTTDSAAVYSIQNIALTPAADTAAIQLTATGDCGLCVALYDSGGQMLDVKQYAVTGGTAQQNLSIALPADRPEDFSIKAFLLDSASHVPLCEAFSSDSSTIDEETYAVTGLRVDGAKTSVIATVSTGGACVIQLTVESADGRESLFTQSLDVEPSLEMAEVSIPLSGTLPEEFRLTAQLVSGSGDPLSNLYTTRAYTRAYQESVNKTAEDFPAAQVLDFGGDGFAVLAEGVEKVSGTAVESDGRYTFQASAVPAVGDTLLLTLENGMPVPVKVGAVTVNGDGTYTVKPDTNVTVSDFYRYLNVSASASAVQVSAGTESVSLAGDDDPATINTGTEIGPVSITLTGGFELEGSVFFDLDMDPSYIEIYGLIHGEGSADVTVQGKYDSGDSLEIPLYISPYIPLGATNLFWQFDVTWPVTFKFEGGGSLNSNFTIDCGYRFDSVNKGQGIWKKTSNAGVKLEAAFSISTGPEFSANLCMAGVPLSLSLGAQIPLVLTGTGKLLEQSQDKVHACNVCLDILLALEPEITGSLEFSITPDLSITPLEITIIKCAFPIRRWYISVINPADSLFKGVRTEGEGFCPNYSYRVDFTALDREGSELTGQEIEVLKDGETVGTALSGGHLFLYNGSYTARMTTAPGRSYETKFTVSGKVAAVTVKEKTTIVELHVADEDTGKPLAGVSVTYTDNVIDHAYSGYATHEDGSCTFQLLPGMHTFVVSMDGYQGSARAVTVGSDKLSVDMTMKRDEPYAKLTVHVVNKDGDPISMPVNATQDGTFAAGGYGPTATFTLDAGTYTVTAISLTSEYKSTSAEVTLAAGEETEITLTVEEVKDPGTVTGTVTDGSTGAVISGAEVTATQNGKIVGSTVTDAEGSYTLSLEGGNTYTITASATGYADSNAPGVAVEENEGVQQDFQLNTGWGWYFENGVLTISGSGPMRNYAYVNDQPWKNVRYSITSVVVKEGITYIGNLSLSWLEKLTSVSLPDSLTSIGDDAFYYCTSLPDITIPGNVTEIGEGAFCQCNSLQSITIPDGVTSVSGRLFNGCDGLTSVALPEGITTIGGNAFSGCSSLTTINIPDSVTTIHIYAFNGCTSLPSITLPNSVVSIGEKVFGSCTSLTSFTIPSGLTSISVDLFSGCKGLTSVSIPSSVTSIGAGAFSGCSSLTGITIPSSVTSIGSDAFNGSGLTSMTVPSSVTSIGSAAFYGCGSLTSINILGPITTLESNTFRECRSLTSVTLPDSVTTIGGAVFYFCTALPGITLPSSVTSIGNWTFWGCVSLVSVAIPEGVTTIGDNLFRDCENLTAVYIPVSVTKIDSTAFGSNMKDIYYGGTEEQWEAVEYIFKDRYTVHCESTGLPS